MRAGIPIIMLFLVASARIAWCAAPASKSAEGASLRGSVTTHEGSPIPQVKVRLLEIGRSARSGEDGHFVMAHVPPGSYSASFERIGFASEVRTVQITPAGATLDVSLRTSMIEVEPIQVTATPKPTSALASPQPISVISSEDLAEASTANLGETIEGTPGVHSLSAGTQIGKPVVRGLRSDRVLVVADGQRLETQQWGDDDSPSVEMVDVERIEVIRGPASVLYGSDALGGVVNVVARELPTAFGRIRLLQGRAWSSYETNDQALEGAMILEGAVGGYGVRGSVLRRGNDDLHSPAGTLRNSGGSATVASGAAGMQGDWGSLNARYSHLEERVQFLADPSEDPDARPFQRNQEDLARLALSTPLGSSRLEASVGFERNRRRDWDDRSLSGEEGEATTGNLAQTITGESRLHHSKMGPCRGLLGLSLTHSAFQGFGLEPEVPNSRVTTLGGYLYEQSEAGAWHVSAGARYDHRILDVDPYAVLAVVRQTRTYDAVTGNLGVLYRASEPVALAMNVGRGFRVPSSFELFAGGVDAGSLTFQRGDPNLKVEQSINADLAVRIGARSWKTELTGFMNYIQDYSYSRPTGLFDPGSGFRIYDVVQGDARLEGFEFSSEWSAGPHWQLETIADYVRGDNLSAGTPLPWIPPMRITGEVTYRRETLGRLRRPYVEMGCEANARQTRLDPADSPTAPYATAEFGAGIELPVSTGSVKLDLTVKNLFDHAYASFLSRYKTFALDPGRSVVLRISTQL